MAREVRIQQEAGGFRVMVTVNGVIVFNRSYDDGDALDGLEEAFTALDPKCKATWEEVY